MTRNPYNPGYYINSKYPDESLFSTRSSVPDTYASHWMHQEKYRPDQPRAPRGRPDGGQWIYDGGSGSRQYGNVSRELYASNSEEISLARTLRRLRDAAEINRGKSREACAQYVRLALASGGIHIRPPKPREGQALPWAKDYGPSLLDAGATIVAEEVRYQRPTIFPPRYQNYTPRAGDVIIFDSYLSHVGWRMPGHMAMFDGSRWISDFVQNSPWPNQNSARAYGPSYRIYRFDVFNRFVP